MKAVKGTPERGLLGATLGFFFGFAAVALFGTTAAKFKDVMHLSPMMIGFLIAIPTLSGSLLRIPFAAWVDTTGGRKPFLILLILSILGMIGLTLVVYALYPNGLTSGIYWLILLLGGLSGCGIATFSVGIGQVSYWFPKARQGRALGMYAGVGNLAPGIFSLLLPFAIAGLGLGGSYLVWLILLVIGTTLYYFTGLNAPYFQYLTLGKNSKKAKEEARIAGEEIFPSGNLTESLRLSAGIWKTWVLVAIYFTTFGGFMALTAWFPTYWKSLFGVTIVTAGVLTAIYSLLTSLSRVAGGEITDRVGGEGTLIAALAFMIIGAVLMMASHSYWVSIGSEILLALGMGVGNAAVFKLVPQEVPQAVGGASGWVGGIGAFGGFVLPPILAVFVRNQGDAGYATGFVVFILLAAAAFGLAFTLKRRPKGKFMAVQSRHANR